MISVTSSLSVSSELRQMDLAPLFRSSKITRGIETLDDG